MASEMTAVPPTLRKQVLRRRAGRCSDCRRSPARAQVKTIVSHGAPYRHSSVVERSAVAEVAEVCKRRGTERSARSPEPPWLLKIAYKYDGTGRVAAQSKSAARHHSSEVGGRGQGRWCACMLARELSL